jgi:hypothetical protein
VLHVLLAIALLFSAHDGGTGPDLAEVAEIAAGALDLELEAPLVKPLAIVGPIRRVMLVTGAPTPLRTNNERGRLFRPPRR